MAHCEWLHRRHNYSIIGMLLAMSHQADSETLVGSLLAIGVGGYMLVSLLRVRGDQNRVERASRFDAVARHPLSFFRDREATRARAAKEYEQSLVPKIVISSIGICLGVAGLGVWLAHHV